MVFMPKPNTRWKVSPHGELKKIENNILTVVGEISTPAGTIPRRMTVARLVDGRLMIFSAIALREESMEQIEIFGTPAYLIVPNSYHRLDIKIWKDRYPSAHVVAPAGARKRVGKIVAVDATSANLADPCVQLVEVSGTRAREFALEVRNPESSTLVLNDIVGNMRGSSGPRGWLMRMMRFAGETPQVPLPVKWTLVADNHALAVQFTIWAGLPRLKRILVSHGEEIADDPAGVLHTLATSLK